MYTKHHKYRQLFSNFSYLSISQLFHILFQIIAFPFLIKILGTNNYGLMVFVESIIIYFQIIINFGFDITATKQISINRDNPEKLNEIVSSIYIIKMILFLISILLISIITYCFEILSSNRILVLFTLWKCFYEILFPFWFFQGIEKMKYIAFLNILSKTFYLILIFSLIESKEDLVMVPAINLLSVITFGLIAQWIVFYKFKISFYFPPYDTVKKYFSEAKYVFFSNLSTRLYVSTNKVVLGGITGMSSVAIYDLAEKIIAGLKIPQKMLSQAIFPKVSFDNNIEFIKQLSTKSLIVNVLLVLIVFMFSENIITILSGKEMLESINILNILLISIPIIAMGNIFGIQLLLPFGYNKEFGRIAFLSFCFYLSIILVLTILNMLNLYSLAIASVLVECFATFLMYKQCIKKQLWR